MRRNELPADLPLPHFRVDEALTQSVALHRLRANDLRAPHWGLRSSDGVPTTLVGRCLEFMPLLASTQGFSHTTAALLWGLPVPLDVRLDDGPLHVTAVRPARAPRRPGITGHRSSDLLVVRHLGLRVVSPLRAWAQCADLLNVDDLVIMGDALVSKWSPYGPARYRTLLQLEKLVTRWRGRRGAAALAEALPLIRLGSWSPKETEVRLFVGRAGCQEPPQLNKRMYGPDGVYLGRPDLAYRDLRLGIEYEGDDHRTSTSTFRRDISRRERFADAGWRIIRVTDADLR